MKQQPKFLIHLGPGKTGSSVIQEWLFSNRDQLLKEGYFYPKHSLDKNGISSGNFSALFSETCAQKNFFDRDKAKQLQKEAVNLGAKYILLSSEAFIARVESIAEYLDSVDFIFYFRNPIESTESLYNQSVKRHFNTSKIKLPESVNYGKLKKLYRICSDSDHSLSLRFYGKRFFEGGNIVQDFLSCIGLDSIKVANSKVINSSYTLEALEFKRSLNRFPLPTLHRELDLFLQQSKVGTSSFSIYSKEQYEQFKTDTVSTLRQLFKELDIQGDKFISYIDSSSQKSVRTQSISQSEAREILLELKNYSPRLFVKVYEVLTSKSLEFLDFDPIRTVITDIHKPQKLEVPVGKSLRKLFNKAQRSRDSYPLEPERLEDLMRNVKAKGRVDEGIFLRELALFFESHGDLLQAFKYMSKAKEYRPHGDLIKKKLIEYAEYIDTKKL